MGFDAQQLGQIRHMKALVATLEKSPELLHEHELEFFATYLKSLGAKLPPKPAKKEHSHDHGHKEEHGGGCCGHDHGHKEKEHDHGHKEKEHGHAHR